MSTNIIVKGLSFLFNLLVIPLLASKGQLFFIGYYILWLIIKSIIVAGVNSITVYYESKGLDKELIFRSIFQIRLILVAFTSMYFYYEDNWIIYSLILASTFFSVEEWANIYKNTLHYSLISLIPKLALLISYFYLKVDDYSLTVIYLLSNFGVNAIIFGFYFIKYKIKIFEWDFPDKFISNTFYAIGPSFVNYGVREIIALNSIKEISKDVATYDRLSKGLISGNSFIGKLFLIFREEIISKKYFKSLYLKISISFATAIFFTLLSLIYIGHIDLVFITFVLIVFISAFNYHFQLTELQLKGDFNFNFYLILIYGVIGVAMFFLFKYYELLDKFYLIYLVQELFLFIYFIARKFK